MDELPVELLAQIVDYCDHYSRKQLRCINKIFHDLATPLIFDEVYVATFKHSLAKFTSIASCHLAKHVRKLVFFNDMLPKYTQVGQLLKLDEATASEAYHSLTVDTMGKKHLQPPRLPMVARETCTQVSG